MVRSVAGNLPEQVKNNQSVNTAAGNGGQKMSQYSWFTVYYSNLRKKYISMIVGVVIVLLLGGVIFYVSTEVYSVAQSTAIPIFLPFVALGIGILVYSFSVMDAYDLLVYNEEHMNQFSTRLFNKVRNLLKKHL